MNGWINWHMDKYRGRQMDIYKSEIERWVSEYMDRCMYNGFVGV